MDNANRLDLLGGACAWQLPHDETGPPLARSLLGATMAALGLDRQIIKDGKLAVSETSTNAYLHARHDHPDGPSVLPELWIWARTTPTPRLADQQ